MRFTQLLLEVFSTQIVATNFALIMKGLIAVIGGLTKMRNNALFMTRMTVNVALSVVQNYPVLNRV